MRAAAKVQADRRGDVATHRFVVGGFRLVEGAVVLFAVEQGPAFDIVRPVRLTSTAAAFYRWRTKQAAHQFHTLHQLADVHVIDLGFLDVLDGSTLTGGQ